MLVVAQLAKIFPVFYGPRNVIRYLCHFNSSPGRGVGQMNAVDITEVKSRKVGWDRYGSEKCKKKSGRESVT